MFGCCGFYLVAEDIATQETKDWLMITKIRNELTQQDEVEYYKNRLSQGVIDFFNTSDIYQIMNVNKNSSIETITISKIEYIAPCDMLRRVKENEEKKAIKISNYARDNFYYSSKRKLTVNYPNTTKEIMEKACEYIHEWPFTKTKTEFKEEKNVFILTVELI